MIQIIVAVRKEALADLYLKFYAGLAATIDRAAVSLQSLGGRVLTADKDIGEKHLPDPIDRLLQEHDRQLDFCDELEDLACRVGAEPVTALAGQLLDYLMHDLPIHIEDEELDLFPRLSSRVSSNAELVEVLGQLVSDHEADKELAAKVATDLEALAGGAPLPNSSRFFMNVSAFCANQRRHLSWENRIVLPTARKLLDETEMDKIARSMSARRKRHSIH